jgi:hypothetical protein
MFFRWGGQMGEILGEALGRISLTEYLIKKRQPVALLKANFLRKRILITEKINFFFSSNKSFSSFFHFSFQKNKTKLFLYDIPLHLCFKNTRRSFLLNVYPFLLPFEKNKKNEKVFLS